MWHIKAVLFKLWYINNNHIQCKHQIKPCMHHTPWGSELQTQSHDVWKKRPAGYCIWMLRNTWCQNCLQNTSSMRSAYSHMNIKSKYSSILPGLQSDICVAHAAKKNCAEWIYCRSSACAIQPVCVGGCLKPVMWVKDMSLSAQSSQIKHQIPQFPRNGNTPQFTFKQIFSVSWLLSLGPTNWAVWTLTHFFPTKN